MLSTVRTRPDGAFPWKEGVVIMLVQCCVCKKVRKGGTWTHVSEKELASQHVSHGYCPKCAAEAFAEIRKMSCVGDLTHRHVLSS